MLDSKAYAAPVDTTSIHVGGACSGNPGPGGWAAVLQLPGHNAEIWGGELITTNNRMVLTAAVKALAALEDDRGATILTDNKYLVDGMTLWLEEWKANDWCTSSDHAVKNADLWQMLDIEAGRRPITWAWVRGQAGDQPKARAAVLARAGVKAAKRGDTQAQERGMAR